ncbi:dihydrodipicolinate synthase family protein [Saccharopolyspora sp. 5N102]|uniref:dihydrodipicolinate synthase family protein n=1 Tax=Saccharopolyspora sp. 5N102 TaxID=3375155 RepID=UPI0037B7B2CF
MFTGLSAFPLTPTSEDGIDERGFANLVARLSAAGVDSIGALGSTGGYAYLTREERARAARIAVDAAGGVPVMVGIGALRTSQVRAHAEDAQNAGASAVLLAPVSYQPLNDDEVFGLFEDVSRELSVPLCVYDNPGTTHFTFSDELHGRIAALPNVAAVKIPGIPADQAHERIAALRGKLPRDVAVGVSGDQFAAGGLNGGADLWFSVLGGLLPEHCLAITRAAAGGDSGEATALSDQLSPLWTLFRQYGSIRVVSAAAEHLGLITGPNLPRPLRGLDPAARKEVAAVLDQILAE